MNYFFHRTLPYRLIVSPLTLIRAFVVLALCLGGIAAAQDDRYKLVSPAFAAGQSADQHSFFPVSSADGRFIAFSSQATNLVSFPTSGSCCLPGQGLIMNAFVRDVQLGKTELVSVNRAGTGSGNGSSNAVLISADGRFVVFTSTSSDLVDNDTNGAATDLFFRDTQTHTTTLITVDRAGTGSANSFSSAASISADGRFVAFASTASNLIDNDTNGNGADVFIRDTQVGVTTVVSINDSGTASLPGNSGGPVMTPDGRFVAFLYTPSTSFATNILLRDLQSGITKLVSVNHAGTGGGNNNSFSPSLSNDGRIVAFESRASDLLASPPAFGAGPYIRDMVSEVTTLVSPPVLEFPLVLDQTRAPAVSADGRYVIFGYSYKLFSSLAGELTRGNVARFDRQTGTLSTLPDSAICIGEPARCLVDTFRPSASADGRFVTFAQTAIGFNIKEAVFLGDFVSLTTTNVTTQGIISFNAFPSFTIFPVVSADGHSVGFSTKNKLASQDTNLFMDVYRFDHDPDPAGVNGIINFGQSAYRAEENGGSVSIPVLRKAFGATGATSVQFNTSDLSAQAGSDYTATSGTLTFNPGEDVKFITVPLLNDNVSEGRQTFVINLSNPTGGYVLGSTNASTTVFIHDSIKQSVTINDVATTEGGDAVFTVTLSEAPFQFSAVRFSITDGTATLQDQDYVSTIDPFLSNVVLFNPGQQTSTITVHAQRDLANEPDETFFVNLVPTTDDYTVARQGTGTIHDDRTPVVEFVVSVGAHFSESESAGSTVIDVIRTSGDPLVPFSVNYATADDTASERSDYIAARGRLDFGPGEVNKTFTVLLNDDVFVEDTEKVTLTLSSPTNGAVLGTGTETLFITSNDSAPPTTNPLDDSGFFVTQHYKDFLNRLPDQSGLDFWTNELNTLLAHCDSLPAGEQKRQCVLLARAQISTAFFLSIESQQTGYLVYRFYRESFNRAPTLREFLADTQEIGRNVVVGTPGWEQRFEANKQKFADDWVRRPDFIAAFDSMSNNAYVSTLFLFGGGDAAAEPALQQTLVGGLNATPATETRATVLRKVADSHTVFNRQYNPGLVSMQYFTYLRRNPDDAPDNNLTGYNFWLSKLDAFSVAGEDVRDAATALARIKRAQMVEAFIDSAEYRRRLGP